MPGTVNYAGWTFSWLIPNLSGQGLVISKANFKGMRVLFRAGVPFVLVPYHSNAPTFKDGLGTGTCGQGLPLVALKPAAPNLGYQEYVPGQKAGNDNQHDPVNNPSGAVFVEKNPATLIEPENAVLWAKFGCGNYQYVHRWEFRADGAIHAQVGLGGALHPPAPGKGHIHNFYFRLDFDIVTADNNLVQRLEHQGWGLNQDQWADIKIEQKDFVAPNVFTRWRVINKTPKANGMFRGYEIIPASDGAPDGTYSKADLWVVRYKSGAETGADVACNDAALENNYVSNESVDGEDVVVWYCLRHHHRPRELGEEKKVLPYSFIGLHIEPRDFLDNTPINLYPTTPPSPS